MSVDGLQDGAFPEWSTLHVVADCIDVQLEELMRRRLDRFDAFRENEHQVVEDGRPKVGTVWRSSACCTRPLESLVELEPRLELENIAMRTDKPRWVIELLRKGEQIVHGLTFSRSARRQTKDEQGVGTLSSIIRKLKKMSCCGLGVACHVLIAIIIIVN